MSVELVSDNTLISVETLVGHSVSYILSNGIRRKFMPNVSYKIKAEELRMLFAEPGGEALLRNYLRVNNPKLQREFGVSEDQIEYNWTVQDVDDILLNKPEEYLLDALDFAPKGIIDLIQQRALELELPDMNKCRAISEKTGVNIIKGIENRHKYDAANTSDNVAEKTTRRVKKETATTKTTTKRRVTKTSEE